MYVLFILVALLVFSSYIALTRKFLYWKKRGVPHPKVSKIFGNLSDTIFIKKNLGQIFDDLYRAYPNLPYVGFYRIRQPALLIRDPKLIHEVLIKDFSYFSGNDFEVDKKCDYLTSRSPLFLKGNDWKTSRGQLTPSLTNNKVKTIFEIMDAVSQNFVEHLQNSIAANQGTEIKTLCEKYTMDVSVRTVLGINANSFKSVNTDYITNIRKIVSPGILMSIKFSMLTLLPILRNFLKIKFIPDDVELFFKNTIKNALDYRQKNNIINNDFLQSMQELQQKLGKDNFSEDDITANCLRFFLDGFEASSILLSFVLYELGANIHHQEKLREEITNSLKNKNGNFTFDSIREMKFLNQFLNETMRLHSPGFYLSRRSTKIYKLPPVNNNLEDVLVEPGTPIIIPVYSLHYDPKYFPNPKKFDPERFSDGNIKHKCTFLPFGDGPRICIGQNYGITEVKVAVAHLVLHYDIRINSKTITPLRIDPSYFLLSPIGGIWLNFIKRKKYQ